ncbi:MAG: hypothetical protein EA397_19160 [Deltaproteobacteria bacterium]|nr:MAG: hypothetical protein EA397_19160 [Deltaproteobacteria bacterium]
MMILLLAAAALAEPTGHAHPSEIAQHSALYTKAAESAGSTFQSLESKSEALATALRAYETSLDLLGNDAPAAERERLATLRTTFNRERSVLQSFATTLMEDFDQEFSQAMERVLPKGAQICEPTVSAGASLPGVASRTQPNPDCEGPDLNQQTAAKMDADPSLQAAVEEMLSLDWPELSLEPASQDPIGAQTWIQVYPLFSKLRGSALKSIDRADEEARLPFAAAIERGASTEELATMREDAKAISDKTARARAALAQPILEAIRARSGRKGLPELGFCANPELFGGCRGTQASPSQIDAILSDKKVQRTLR